MSEEPKGQEKKIIIDEDWKGKVQAEKEAAARKQQSAESAPAESAPAESAPPESAPPESAPAKSPSDAAEPLPPPNLTFLASSLYLQGMVSLGLLPGPTSDKPQVHLEHAKHTIDTLQMLQEKTEGNRTPDETKEMDTMLHELRLSYIAVQQQGEEAE